MGLNINLTGSLVNKLVKKYLMAMLKEKIKAKDAYLEQLDITEDKNGDINVVISGSVKLSKDFLSEVLLKEANAD